MGEGEQEKVSNINECLFSGNLTRDAEYKISANGVKYVTFSIAVNNRVYDATTDQYIDVPQFVDFIAFGDIADDLKEVEKGTRLFVRSRLEQGMYRDKTGKIRRRNNFKAIEVNVMEKRNPPAKKPWRNSNWY